MNGVEGWRLADTVQPDASCDTQVAGVSLGTNCTGSELGNLFYNVLGGEAGQSIDTVNNANYDLFSNIVTNFEFYWSATEVADNTNYAWMFNFTNGFQEDDINSSDNGNKVLPANA